jgi:hypothetical protein
MLYQSCMFLAPGPRDVREGMFSPAAVSRGSPPVPSTPNMTGDKLLSALRGTKHKFPEVTVDFIRDGLTLAVHIDQAIAMARSGMYRGGGRRRRVKFMELLPALPPPPPKHQICWRTAFAAVCAPSYGYEKRSRGGFTA